MDEPQIVVFTADRALEIGFWLGLGAAMGAGLAIVALDTAGKVIARVLGKPASSDKLSG